MSATRPTIATWQTSRKYNAGRMARIAGKEIGANPYPAFSEAACAWEEGWRSEVPISGADVRKFFPEYETKRGAS